MPDAPSDGEMFPSNPENMDDSDASNESMNAEEDAASANVDDDDESVNGVDAGMSSRHSSDDESCWNFFFFSSILPLHKINLSSYRTPIYDSIRSHPPCLIS